MSAIDVRGLVVQFGGVTALRDVTFSIPAERVVAVVGPNGAGKSTLLNSINGVVRPTAGEVSVLGTRVDGRRADQVAALGVHRSFQHPHLLEKDTVLENMMVGGFASSGSSWRGSILRPRSHRRSELLVRSACERVLGAAGIAHLADATVSELSYGTKKLIDIARAMVGNPDVLMLDEPSSGLGHEDRRHLIDLLGRFRAERRCTTLIVEHHMDVVRAVADDVIALAGGEVARTAAVSDVSDLESLGISSPSFEDAEPLMAVEDRS